MIDKEELRTKILTVLTRLHNGDEIDFQCKIIHCMKQTEKDIEQISISDRVGVEEE